MSSLQAALPNAQLSSSFLGDVSESWFPQSPVASYIPAAGQGMTSDGNAKPIHYQFKHVIFDSSSESC